jgi:hypothetical protein
VPSPYCRHLDQPLLGAWLRAFGDQRSIDLRFAKVERLDVREARIAGAKVVFNQGSTK